MRNESSLAWKTLVLTLVACSALIGAGTGCGGDDSDEAAAGEGGAGASGTSGGTGGTNGGTSGGGSGGTGGAGSGGMGGAGGGLPMITCTEELPTTPLTCGGTECPMPMDFMGIDTCQRPCCVADACGSKSTIEGMASDCVVPATPDPLCPTYDLMGQTIQGCCIDDQCGIISAIRGNGCYTTSMFLDLPATPPACDGSGLTDDAGTP